MSEKRDWDGKSKGTVFGYKIFMWLLRNLGIHASYVLLYFVTLYYFFFSAKSNKYSYFFFRKICGYSALKARIATYQSYYIFGQTILDKVAIQSGIDTHVFTNTFDGRERLYELAALDRGAILISAHLGNWEMAGHFLNKLNTPVNLIMFDEEHERIKALLADSMTERKFKIIAIKPDLSHLFKIYEALKHKEFICIHGDRYIADRERAYVTDFLGYKAAFPRGPFELAKRFKVPYIFVFAIKEGKTHYRFQATLPSPEASHSIEAMIEDYLQNVSKIVRAYPEQWFNYYDFWDIDTRLPETRKEVEDINKAKIGSENK
jgi:predicted LPLAT superfamily acyltransferase